MTNKEAGSLEVGDVVEIATRKEMLGRGAHSDSDEDLHMSGAEDSDRHEWESSCYFICDEDHSSAGKMVGNCGKSFQITKISSYGNEVTLYLSLGGGITFHPWMLNLVTRPAPTMKGRFWI